MYRYIKLWFVSVLDVEFFDVFLRSEIFIGIE